MIKELLSTSEESYRQHIIERCSTKFLADNKKYCFNGRKKTNAIKTHKVVTVRCRKVFLIGYF